jgi:hypothetical protein
MLRLDDIEWCTYSCQAAFVGHSDNISDIWPVLPQERWTGTKRGGSCSSLVASGLSIS